jgi:hypothetical protein
LRGPNRATPSVDLLRQHFQRGLQRRLRETLQRGPADGAGGGQGQVGGLFAMRLGYGLQRRHGRRHRLGDVAQGHGADVLDLAQRLLAGFQPALRHQGIDLGRQIGAFGRRPGARTHDRAVGVELGVEGEEVTDFGGLGHVSRSARRRSPGRPA